MTKREPDDEGGNAAGPRDWGYHGLLALLGGVAIWVLAMPWVPGIAAATMRRFHLSSDSFVSFAAGQPIPSMYNFANRVEIHEIDPQDDLLGMIDPVLGMIGEPAIEAGPGLPLGMIGRETVNHFPLRRLTFADGQYKYLRGGTRWIVATSDYRGRRLTTRWRIDPASASGEPWRMTRQSLQWSVTP